MWGKLKNLARSVRARRAESVRRQRLAAALESPAFLDFWRANGREWAAQEASPEDRAAFAALAGRAPAEIEAALKARWARGFTNPEEAYGWGEMGDGLPPGALAAFVAGVAEAPAQAAP